VSSALQPRDPSWHKASRYPHSAGGTTSASSAFNPAIHPGIKAVATNPSALSSLFLHLPRGHPVQSPFASLRANLRFTIFALSCFVSPQVSALKSQPSSLSPQPSALKSQLSQPSALKSQPSALKPQPSSLSSLSPQPSALSSLSPLSIPRSAQNQAHTIEPQVRLGDMPRHIGDHIFGNLDLLLTHIRVHLTQLL
jgi:hypothetical protein